jgi:hypothetical protein
VLLFALSSDLCDTLKTLEADNNVLVDGLFEWENHLDGIVRCDVVICVLCFRWMFLESRRRDRKRTKMTSSKLTGTINACLVCTSHEHDWIDCCPAYEAYLTLVPAVRAINDSKLEGTLESENRSGAINLHETEVGTRQGQVVHEVH